MKEGYKEIKDVWGMNIESVVNRLLSMDFQGVKACIEFNGHELYSDDITMDSAYLKITGQTKAENDKWHKDYNDKYEREKQEHIDNIPKLTAHWIKEAIGVIRDDKLEYWNTVVPIRLGDLYRGMELGCTIDITKILNKGVEYFKEAKDALNNQDHSGMSYGLMKNMIHTFCVNGEDFIERLNRKEI